MEFLKDGEVAKQENNFAVPWQTRLADNPMSLATSVFTRFHHAIIYGRNRSLQNPWAKRQLASLLPLSNQFG